MGMGAPRTVDVLRLLFTLAAGCAREDVELARDAPEPAVDAGAERGMSGASGVPSAAARVFAHGLCSCTDATFTSAFAIDAFDSADGPYAQGQSGADVGIDNQLATTAPVDIRGALITAGEGLLPITVGPCRVEGNFETNADLTITSSEVTFGRDLWVNGEILALGSVSVAGDVYQPAGHAGADGVVVGGQVRTQEFTVAPPCACGDDERLDVAAIVAEGMLSNDNRTLGVASDGLYTGAGGLALGCGRFAFAGGNVLAGTAVDVRGRSELFVAGDLLIAGRFAGDPDPDGEIDVFVAGDLILADGAEVGSIARPAALRLYVSGEGDIAVIGALSFAANLYAPRASVVLTSEQELYGSLFVEAYHGVANQVMHYDRAVQRAAATGESCAAPP